MAVRTAYVPVAGAVLTAANLAKMSPGWIGYVTGATNTGGISVITDITGMTVTVTVGTGRLLKITGIVNTNSSALAQTTVSIREATTVLGASMTYSQAAAPFQTQTVTAIVNAPSAGAHTYKLSLTNSAGNGAYDGSITPMILFVEDLGSTP